MIPAIIRASIANRVIIVALAAMMAVAGVWAIRATPVDAIPDLSDVQVIVRTPYAGQAPQVVEDQITYPIATAMLDHFPQLRDRWTYLEADVSAVEPHPSCLCWYRSTPVEP